jgi:hypothetical protein
VCTNPDNLGSVPLFRCVLRHVSDASTHLRLCLILRLGFSSTRLTVASAWHLRYPGLVSLRLDLLLVSRSLMTLGWIRWTSGVFSRALRSLGVLPRLEIYISAGRLGLRLHAGAKGQSLSTLAWVVPYTKPALGFMHQLGLIPLSTLVTTRLLITDGGAKMLIGLVFKVLSRIGNVTSSTLPCTRHLRSLFSRWLISFPSQYTNYGTPITPSTLDYNVFSLSNRSPSFPDPSNGAALYSPFESDSWDSPWPRDDFGTTSDAPGSLIPSKRRSNDISGIDMSPESGSIPRLCRPKSQHQITLLTILRDLQSLRCTVIDLLLAVIDGSGEFKGFRSALFSSRNNALVVKLLETLIKDEKGRSIVTDWMSPHALHLICEKIHKEMEEAKPSLRMNMGDVTPEFIEQWDIEKIMGPVARDTTRE